MSNNYKNVDFTNLDKYSIEELNFMSGKIRNKINEQEVKKYENGKKHIGECYMQAVEKGIYYYKLICMSSINKYRAHTLVLYIPHDKIDREDVIAGASLLYYEDIGWFCTEWENGEPITKIERSKYKKITTTAFYDAFDEFNNKMSDFISTT